MSKKIENYIGYDQGQLGDLSGVVWEPRYTLKDIDNLSYRTLNYWDEKKFLLPVERETTDKWRRFSFVEYIWIKILQELMDMGVALPEMVKSLLRYFGTFGYMDAFEPLLKKEFTSDYWFEGDNKRNAAERFSRFLAVIVVEKNPAAIRLYSDGYCQTIWGNPKAEVIELFFKDTTRDKEFESFVQVSIGHIISQLLIKATEQPAKGRLDNILIKDILNENEAELLRHLRRKDVSELTIRLTDGEIKMIELTEKGQIDDLGTRLSDWFVKEGYQEITYKTNGGKRVSFERTTKMKL